MASHRNVQDNNILHNKESDVREELSEVQSEIKDLLPTWTPTNLIILIMIPKNVLVL